MISISDQTGIRLAPLARCILGASFFLVELATTILFSILLTNHFTVEIFMSDSITETAHVFSDRINI